MAEDILGSSDELNKDGYGEYRAELQKCTSAYMVCMGDDILSDSARSQACLKARGECEQAARAAAKKGV